MNPMRNIASSQAHSLLPKEEQVTWPEDLRSISSRETDCLIQNIFTRTQLLNKKEHIFLMSRIEQPVLHHKTIWYLKEELTELETHKTKILNIHNQQKTAIESSWNSDNQNPLVQLIYWVCKSILLWQIKNQFTPIESHLENEIETVRSLKLGQLAPQNLNANRIVTTIACSMPFYLSQSNPNKFNDLLATLGKVLEQDPDVPEGLILTFRSPTQETCKVYIELIGNSQDNLFAVFSDVQSQKFTQAYRAQAVLPNGTVSRTITHKSSSDDDSLELHSLLEKTSEELYQIFNNSHQN